MIQYELSADDLADTRFAISPIQELVCSLWALRDPGRYTLHLPWRRAALAAIAPDDLDLLMSLVGKSRALPDFLTPRPATFAPTVEEQIDLVRRTPADLVDRDITATHAPGPVPAVLRAATLENLADLLERYWTAAGAATSATASPRAGEFAAPFGAAATASGIEDNFFNQCDASVYVSDSLIGSSGKIEAWGGYSCPTSFKFVGGPCRIAIPGESGSPARPSRTR